MLPKPIVLRRLKGWVRGRECPVLGSWVESSHRSGGSL